MTREDREKIEEIDNMIARSRELRERSRSLVQICREQIARSHRSHQSTEADAAAEPSEATAASE